MARPLQTVECQQDCPELRTPLRRGGLPLHGITDCVYARAEVLARLWLLARDMTLDIARWAMSR